MAKKTAMQKLFDIVWEASAHDLILHEDEGIEWLDEEHSSICIVKDYFIENEDGDTERIILSCQRYHDPISFSNFIASRIIEIGESDGPKIEDLNLNTRAFNALRRAGVWTIGDLRQMIRANDIVNVRNFGRKSYDEVITKLAAYDKNMED